MSNKVYYVYKITNQLDGKIYIGKRYGPLKEKYFGSGLWIKRAINKYGIENFSKEILQICDKSTIDEVERSLILEYNAQDPTIGYNITDGGDGGDTYKGRSWKEVSTPEVYENRLKQKKQRDEEYWTTENCQKLSKAVKKKQWSGKKGKKRKQELSKRVSGANNPSAKTYKIITPTKTFVITSLRTFCKENNLIWNTVKDNVGKGIIKRRSKKDTSFARSETKRRIEGWEIIELK